METPTEGEPKADTNARKVRPEVEGFIDRGLVPALVKRYILELKQGKRPNTRGSVGGSKTISQNP
jgi:DNA polymerase elongation subunit (family B)